MKHPTIIATIGVLLFLLLGCGRTTVTPIVSVSSFHVDSDTGVANGEAFGIEFKVAGASRAEVTSEVSGSPKSSSRMAITLADDLKIDLETLDDGKSVAFRMNGKSMGNLKRGDQVAIGKDRSVMVDGEKRTNAESSPE